MRDVNLEGKDFSQQKWQRWLRIQLAIAAYAYEYEDVSLISDSAFDAMCLLVDPEIPTVEDYHKGAQRQRYERLDKFFKTEFSPYTGQWIRSHPELSRVERDYKWFCCRKGA